MPKPFFSDTRATSIFVFNRPAVRECQRHSSLELNMQGPRPEGPFRLAGLIHQISIAPNNPTYNSKSQEFLLAQSIRHLKEQLTNRCFSINNMFKDRLPQISPHCTFILEWDGEASRSANWWQVDVPTSKTNLIRKYNVLEQ
uniref:Uncharacterized protein n=1 Tax=Cucumis melo TaxID=3656 RepID=A0A9I9ECB0_CUCME